MSRDHRQNPDFIIASTYAANGRDALLFAPSMPAVSMERASVAGPESALETAIELHRLCGVIADRLDHAVAVAASQADAKACAEGQHQARRLKFLLSGLLDP